MSTCPRWFLLLVFALPAAVRADAIIYTNADSYVRSYDPDANFGSDTEIRVLGATWGQDIGYLSFDVTGAIPVGNLFTSATLGLEWGSMSGSPSVDAHLVTGSWSEATITWNNQPGYSPTVLDTQGATLEAWTWDVSAAWPGTGHLDLALVSSSSGAESVTFLSKDLGVSHLAPRLTIAYEPAPIPEPGSLVLLGLGLPMAGLWLRRRRNARS